MRKYLSRSRDIAAGDCYQFLAFGGKYSGNNALDRDIGDAEDTPTYGSLLSSMSRLHFPDPLFFAFSIALLCQAQSVGKAQHGVGGLAQPATKHGDDEGGNQPIDSAA